MTADNVTSSRLRELSRLASPAPWVTRSRELWSGDSRVGEFDFMATSERSRVSLVESQDNARLVVALRNDAEKYADLRDAAKEMLEALSDTRYHGIELGALGDPMRSLRAALAALGGEE